MWLDFDIFFTLIILIFFSIWRRFKVQFYSFENLTFQNFLRPWWRTKIIFGHIWGIFLQFLECFKCNFSHLRTSKFRIFLQFVEENFKCNFSYLGTSLFKIFPTMVEDNDQCFWWYGLLQQSFSHLNPHSLALVAFQKKCLLVYPDWGCKGLTFFWTI